MNLCRKSAVCVVLVAATPAWTFAQPPERSPRQLSFEESALILAKKSDTISGADLGVQAAQTDAHALKRLNFPTVSLDAQELQYQKTVEVSLIGLKTQAEGAASNALSSIAEADVPGDTESTVTSQVQAALPGVFSSIPNSLSVRTQQTLFHPTVSAILPLYTGGAISAAQKTADAAVALAKAQYASAQDLLQLELVKAYFGQVLAAHVLKVTRDAEAGFARHLEDARKLEKAGQLSHAHTLEVEVAWDAARRASDKADGEYRTSVDTLASLVHSDTSIEPTTALFISTLPLGPVAPFVDAAEADHPQLHEAQAAVAAARQGVRLAHAQQLPSVYVFGEYNLNRSSELVTEPDWIFGIGVHYKLFSNIDRQDSEHAARLKQSAAEAAERQAHVDLRTNIGRAWNLTETSRKQFLTLDSSLVSAAESLRVQETSFREGEATAVEVIDARNILEQVRVQRAAAAYEYDLALAALLLSSGQTAKFVDYLRSADRRISA